MEVVQHLIESFHHPCFSQSHPRGRSATTRNSEMWVEGISY